MSDPIRVLIVDDHLIVRKGIRALMATEPDVQVVGEASNGREALALVEATQPDVVLMDLVMPEMDGIAATREIGARWPKTRVLVLTSFAADDKVGAAVKAGAAGYLLKDSGAEELLNGIRQVHRGESSLHPVIARKVMQELSSLRGQGEEQSPLTERETEVLRLLAQGFGNQEIGRQLVISEATVRTHVSNILSKLQLASRTQAALYAVREGIVPLPDGTPPRSRPKRTPADP